MDSRGLLTSDRDNLTPEKLRFAKDPRKLGLRAGAALSDVVAALKPTALIGAAAVGGAFSKTVIDLLLKVSIRWQV